MRFSDKIAYLGRDIEDAIVAGFIHTDDIPENIRQKVGDTNSNIISYLVNDLVTHSTEEAIGVSQEAHELMLELRKFNYTYIYKHPMQLQVEKSCAKIIAALFEYLMGLNVQMDWETGVFKGAVELTLDSYYVDYLQNMREFYLKESSANGWSEEEMGKQIVSDYISGMTDRFALDCMKEISLPHAVRFRHGRGTF